MNFCKRWKLSGMSGCRHFGYFWFLVSSSYVYSVCECTLCKYGENKVSFCNLHLCYDVLFYFHTAISIVTFYILTCETGPTYTLYKTKYNERYNTNALNLPSWGGGRFGDGLEMGKPDFCASVIGHFFYP